MAEHSLTGQLLDFELVVRLAMMRHRDELLVALDPVDDEHLEQITTAAEDLADAAREVLERRHVCCTGCLGMGPCEDELCSDDGELEDAVAADEVEGAEPAPWETYGDGGGETATGHGR